MLYRSICRQALSAAHRRTLQHATRSLATKPPRGPIRFAGEAVEDRQIGDYPDLPWIHYSERDPFKYDDQQARRNFGDPVSNPKNTWL
jgi:hypothetical protein